MSSDSSGVTPAKRLAICSSDLGAVVPGQLGGDGTGLDHGDAHADGTPSWRSDSEKAPTPNLVRL